jgi:methyl-galactoside transport system substrate-binding protein
MKRILLIITVFLTLSLASCASNDYKVGLLIYNEDDTFIGEFENYILNSTPKGVKFLVRHASGSQSIQNEQIISLIEEGCKILIVNMVDRLAGGTIIEKAKKNNVRIIFFNREPVEADMYDSKFAYYVGSDPVDAGYLQSKMAAKLFGEASNLNSKYDKNNDGIIQMLILKGEQSHQDAEKRTDSNIRYFKDNGYNIEVLKTVVANFTKEEGYKALKDNYPIMGNSLELILSNNDDMAKGAIDYLLDEGIFIEDIDAIDQKIIIIGVDATNVGIESIDKGFMYGTILNDSKRQSEVIIDLLDYLRNNKSFYDFPYVISNDNYIYLHGMEITKVNLSEIIK